MMSEGDGADHPIRCSQGHLSRMVAQKISCTAPILNIATVDREFDHQAERLDDDVATAILGLLAHPLCHQLL